MPVATSQSPKWQLQIPCNIRLPVQNPEKFDLQWYKTEKNMFFPLFLLEKRLKRLITNQLLIAFLSLKWPIQWLIVLAALKSQNVVGVS